MTGESTAGRKDRRDCVAASTDLAALSERDFWPLIKQAKERVLTNDLDALEALIVGGLPADEMQAAAWVLVQRVRGLQADLMRVERARAAWQREAHGTPSAACVPERFSSRVCERGTKGCNVEHGLSAATAKR
jgi:hypothetical protein